MSRTHPRRLALVTFLALAGCAGRNSAPTPAARAIAEHPTATAPSWLSTDRADAALLAALRINADATAVHVDNLANADTTAYHALRPRWLPDGTFATGLDQEQGPFEVTNRNLDVAIEGPGFFRVKILDSIGDGFAYTRNGSFFVNHKGELVVGLGDGYRLDPPINVPRGVTEKDVSIAQDGFITVKLPGGGTAQIGTLKVAHFVNPAGLEPHRGSLYRETLASGISFTSSPGENGSGIIRAGALEGSNVDVHRERLAIERLREWREVLLRSAGLK